MSPNTPFHRRRWLAGLTAVALSASGVSMMAGSAGAVSPKHPRLNAPSHQKLTTPGSSDSGANAYAPRSVSKLPKSGSYAFWVTLKTASTGKVFQATRNQGLNAAREAARTQLRAATSAQNALIGKLPQGSAVLYRTHASLTGVGVRTDVRNLHALRALPNVAAVYPITPKSPAMSYAGPLQGAPAAWEGMGSLGGNTTIADIDTGIDYTHADFGGPGTKAAYDAELAKDTQPADPSMFPSSKIIGGYDLVGDDYQANPTNSDGSANPNYQPVPHPDTNPLDCNGHGTHTAGIAAGLGENADGSTYTGAYDSSTPFGSMKIGPGIAPKAKLISYRVFGCAGSTDVVTAAIDKAMDPNGDGDTSDHADVINMSLGSPYGDPQDADAVASDNAAKAGIVLAISAGNDGDETDAGGSPGNSVRGITVASSVDASNIVDGLHVSFNGNAQNPMPATRAVLYTNWDAKDLTGDVAVLPNTSTTSTPNDTACKALDTTQAAAVAGKVAVVRWTDGPALECGSIGRGANLRNAGAVGFIFVMTQPGMWSAGINGDTVIPGVLTDKASGDAIKAALIGGQTVTATGTTAADVTTNFPGDDNKVSDFSSRGFHGEGATKPDVAAVGATVMSAGYGTGNDGLSESGTSMAAPMVAGEAALVRALHPDWTPEQVKADIVNTAGQDVYVNGSQAGGTKYAPVRVGAGRIKVDAAVANTTLAYLADGTGAVSASFGPVAVSAPTSLSKTIKVQNTGNRSVTYDVSYDAITTVDGATYSVSPSTVTIDPRSSKTVTVTLSLDPTALDKTVDPTIGRTDPATHYPRETMAEASGRVLLAPATGNAPTLRVPVYAAPRAASTLTQPSSVTLAPDGSGTLTTTGSDLGAGTNNGSGATKVASQAAGFELLAKSDTQPACSATVDVACWNIPWEKAGDVKYVGVTSDMPYYGTADNSMAYFAISNYAPVSTPASKVYYQVDIDTTGDHVPDYVLYNSRLGDGDVFVSNLVDLSDGSSVDVELLDARFGNTDVAAYDSDSLVLPLWLGATDANNNPVIDTANNPRINFGISTWTTASNQPIDLVGEDADGNVSLTADLANPAVTVDDGSSVVPMSDTTDGSLNVWKTASTYKADHGMGLLMLHFHNANGNKAQVVSLKKAAPGTVSLTATPNPAQRGQVVTEKVSVAYTGTVPTGSVTVKDNTGAVVGTGTLDASGSATFTHSWAKAGSYKLTASYSGDDNYDPSTSAPVTLTVAKSKSAMSLAFKPKTGRHGKVSKATVTVATVAGVPATGQVVLKAGAKTLGKGKLVNGKAVIKFKPRSKGKLKVKAVYKGDSNYLSGSKAKTYRVL